MCDCWGCRTGNGHGKEQPADWVPGASPLISAVDRAAWVEAASGEMPEQLDVTYVVLAYEVHIKTLESENERLERIVRTVHGKTCNCGVCSKPDPLVAERDALRKYAAGVITAGFNRYGMNMDRPRAYESNGEPSGDGSLIRSINCLRGLLDTVTPTDDPL